MAKNDEPEEAMRYPPRRGMAMMIVPAVLIMVGMLGGAYLLSLGNYAPNVNVNGGPTNPNIYVSSQPPQHVVSVSATVTQNVAPDLLLVYARVRTEATTAKASQSDNAVVVADLLPKLKALGLADSDIQTTAYSVDPVYNSSYVCDKSGMNCRYESSITGYTTTQGLLLNVKQLDKGGDVIDAASTAGENQTFVDSVSFTLQDATRASLEKALLKNASTESKAKAQNIADGLGVSLGKVLSASESYSYYPQPYYDYKVMDMAGQASSVPPTQLSSGQVDVSVTVSTSFEMQ
jgi:uncharacterized protein YggE